MTQFSVEILNEKYLSSQKEEGKKTVSDPKAIDSILGNWGS
jgi:hypothetical protein